MCACFHPIKAFYPLETTSDGKRYLLFGRKRYQAGLISNFVSDYVKELYNNGNDFDYDCDFPYQFYHSVDGDVEGLNIKVPCGKCLGCRLDYSRSWALRSVHEAKLYDNYKNCAFVTLTFNNEMLNRRENPHSINKAAFRTWIKRFRKAVKVEYGVEFRIMACGEYGSRHKRPHYHFLVYGFNFPDKRVFQYNHFHNHDVLYYRSPFLEKIWSPAHSSESYGFSVIGDVNFESSAYVARYVTKKLFGKVAAKVYTDIEPEFLTTSRRPGLGYEFFRQNYREIIDRGYCYNPKGFKAPIPRYYVKLLEKFDQTRYINYRMTCFNNMCDNLFIENLDNTQERLIVKEELKRYNLDILKRQYEFNV